MAEENIFLFVPNLIGYARIILALLAFYFMQCCPFPAVFCYLLSAFLDALDGHAARALNQATKFGAMLDMITDRCATMCLLVNLALLYPSYAFLFQLSMSLDISSHWLHLHSSMMKGISSHKTIDLSGNPILRLYYTSRSVLFVMCMGNELFFCLLYIMYYIEETSGMQYSSVKGNGLSGFLSSDNIDGLMQEGLWLQGLLAVSAVICLLKSGISVLHLITASRNMVAMDVAEREKEKGKKE